MTAFMTKMGVLVFFLLLAYYLLVYYKGGTAYIGSASSAFNTGATTFLGAAKQGYQ